MNDLSEQIEKTAIIYARVSDRKQVEGEISIPSQIDKGKEEAETLGACLLKTFIDGGKSGRSTRGRSDFLDAIEYCEIYSVNYFIIWNSARFARNRLDAAIYKNRLDKNGTKLVYISMSVDRDTDFGRLIDGFLEVVDEAKSIQTSADTKRSMISNAKNGFWNGGTPPYGFFAEPHPDHEKRKKLSVHLDEAAMVKMIFDLREKEGIGAQAIALRLNEQEYKNRGKRWNKSAISNLLHNEAVIGKSVFGRKDRRSGRRRPKEEWIIVDAHEPIIPIDLWNKVQKIMQKETPQLQAGSPHSTYLFTGLLRCGECGSSMQIESAKGYSKRYWYYNCRASAHDKNHKPRRIQSRAFDSWLIDEISARVFSRETLRELLYELNKSCSNWSKDRQLRRQSILRKMESVENKNEKLFELFELHGKNAPNLKDLTHRLRLNNTKIENLEHELKAIDAESAPSISINSEDLDALAEFLVDTIKATDNPKRIRAFLSSFIRDIYVGWDKVRIDFSPSSLLATRTLKVPSKGIWLPGTVLPGTEVMLINILLPKQFQKAA